MRTWQSRMKSIFHECTDRAYLQNMSFGRSIRSQHGCEAFLISKKWTDHQKSQSKNQNFKWTIKRRSTKKYQSIQSITSDLFWPIYSWLWLLLEAWSLAEARAFSSVGSASGFGISPSQPTDSTQFGSVWCVNLSMLLFSRFQSCFKKLTSQNNSCMFLLCFNPINQIDSVVFLVES